MRKAVVALAKALKEGTVSQDSFFAGDFARKTKDGRRFSTLGAAKPKGAGGAGLWEGFRIIGILDIFG